MKKKPRGIFERPKGSDVWWVRYHDANGQEHREKAGPKSLALAVYKKRKTEVREGRFFPELIRRRDVRLADAIDEYLTDRKHKASYRDLKRYGAFWKTELGTDRTLRQIDKPAVDRIAARRRGEVEEQTLVHELSFLRRVFKAAIAAGNAERNPVGKLSVPNNRRVRWLTVEEEGSLQEKMQATDFALVAFAIATGMRRGEQFGLRREWVDLANSVIRIPQSKNGTAREVTLNDTAKAILRGLPASLRTPYVFVNETGTNHRHAANFVRRVFNPAVAAAGIKNFHWHDLRHTFASRLVMAGTDLRTVQELMGHKTVAMTTRYAHLSPGHKLAAVQRLNSFGKQAPTGTRTGTGTGEGNGEAS